MGASASPFAATVNYRARWLPDLTDPALARSCGEPLGEIVGREFASLLRMLAEFPPGSAVLTHRWAYDPEPRNGGLQSRLAIALILGATEQKHANVLICALESSPLAKLYGFVRKPEPEKIYREMRSVCELTRRQRLIEPLVSPEFNDRVPSSYYEIDAFEPNEQNDYSRLERLLGRLTERVVIELTTGPADHRRARRCHAAYLAHLARINRRRDDEEDRDLLELRYPDGPERPARRMKRGIASLRLEDPLAEETRRSQVRFSETLRKPHLCFGARVYAESPAVAHLVGSALAESAFEQGSYRIQHHNLEKSASSANHPILEKSPLPASGNGSGPSHADDSPYGEFKSLARMAPVDQLTALLRLPVASCGSPSCIRAHTDPEPLDEETMIILGYDEEPANDRM